MPLCAALAMLFLDNYSEKNFFLTIRQKKVEQMPTMTKRQRLRTEYEYAKNKYALMKGSIVKTLRHHTWCDVFTF